MSKITIYGGLPLEDNCDGSESALRTPRNIPDFNETITIQVPGTVVQICSGHGHVLILTSDGTLHTHGSNQFGQLGQQMTNVEQIAAGLYHSVALTKEGKVYVWGRGTEGQLGLGDNENQDIPQYLMDADEVACGSFHTLIRKGRTLYVMGENQNGQLGVSGQQINKPQKLSIPVDQMAAGLDHSIFLSGNAVYVTGNNLFGQCGLQDQVLRQPTLLPLDIDVKKVLASMGTFSGVISKTNKVYFWGTGSWGYARKCTPIEDLCKIDQKIQDVYLGENFALLKADNWYIFGLNKVPENYQSLTHRIQLQKVELPQNALIAVGLNVVFASEACKLPLQNHNTKVKQVEQSMQKQEYYKQEYQKQDYQKQDYQRLKESYTPKELPKPLTKSEFKSESMVKQEFSFKQQPQKPEEGRQPSKSEYHGSNKQESIQTPQIINRDQSSSFSKQEKCSANEMSNYQKLQADIKADEQQYFKFQTPNNREQIREEPRPAQPYYQVMKCGECSQARTQNEYLQRCLKAQTDEMSSLKREVEFLKGQIKSKDLYTQELETRIQRVQGENYVKPHELRLKSEEKQDIRVSKIIEQSPQRVIQMPIIETSPSVLKYRVIDNSPQARVMNTSIFEKIQSYSISKRQQPPMIPRYSANELQNQQPLQNSYVLPQQYYRR